MGRKLLDILGAVPFWVGDYFRQKRLARLDWDAELQAAFDEQQSAIDFGDEDTVRRLYENINLLDGGHVTFTYPKTEDDE